MPKHDHREPSTFRYVFGPVISRRLGRSLGVDLVPFKTCTYDCIYCQLGRTTCKTVARKEYVPLAEVLEELDRKLALGQPFDYMTLAGSGEPTLHSGVGRFIVEAKRRCTAPIAVITNGSLLWDADVRRDLMNADLVIPSLDAGFPASFQSVNRPDESITFEAMTEGLAAFRGEFPKKIWLEILLVDGVTANDEEIAALAALARRIEPDRVQLTTITRPPAAGPAKPVPREELERFAQAFAGVSEVLAPPLPTAPTGFGAATPEEVLDILQRHPCSVDDVATSLNIHPDDAARHIGTLLDGNLVDSYLLEGAVMYTARRVK